jgi:hypothetical protein
MENKKIRFKELSAWLKLAVICSWFLFGVMCINFLIGFFLGLNLNI